MNAGRFALDTNVAIHYLAGQAEVRDRIETSSSRFALAFATVGELYFGAYKSTRVAENRARVDELVASCDVLHTGPETVALFGELKGDLSNAGTRIPENDIWIAASCIVYGMTIVTRDKHFETLSHRVKVTQW